VTDNDKNLGLDMSHIMKKALDDLERFEVDFEIETAHFTNIRDKATFFVRPPKLDKSDSD